MGQARGGKEGRVGTSEWEKEEVTLPSMPFHIVLIFSNHTYISHILKKINTINQDMRRTQKGAQKLTKESNYSPNE